MDPDPHNTGSTNSFMFHITNSLVLNTLFQIVTKTCTNTIYMYCVQLRIYQIYCQIHVFQAKRATGTGTYK
jgi:hypothetical protein